MEEDSDPEEFPQTGSYGHPIELSSGSNSVAGSPFRGPDEFDQRWAQYVFVNKPSYHSTSHHQNRSPHPHQEDVEMQQVDQPQPPLESSSQPRRRRGARMSVRAGQRSGSLPPLPPSYPVIPEDPQMGGPSNTSPVVEPPPQPAVEPLPQPPLPPPDFANPIPAYTGPSGFHTVDPPGFYNYIHPGMEQDSYYDVVIHNNLYHSSYPSYPPPYATTGYPSYGYPYPIAPQPQPPPPQPQPQAPLEAINEALDQVREMRQQVKKSEKKNNEIIKKLYKAVKGRNDD